MSRPQCSEYETQTNTSKGAGTRRRRTWQVELNLLSKISPIDHQSSISSCTPNKRFSVLSTELTFYTLFSVYISHVVTSFYRSFSFTTHGPFLQSSSICSIHSSFFISFRVCLTPFAARQESASTLVYPFDLHIPICVYFSFVYFSHVEDLCICCQSQHLIGFSSHGGCSVSETYLLYLLAGACSTAGLQPMNLRASYAFIYNRS